MKKLLAAILFTITVLCTITACNTTPNPTAAPTPSTSVEETLTPSQAPTATPTVAPSVVPTVEETVAPSVEISVEPSVDPTVQPSVEPTITPSVEPTITPSVEPTVEETVAPSVEISVEPSVDPTVQPSVEPTITPSVEPTVEETVAPSVEPTVEETIAPTVEPTVVPTVTPTVTPTVEPTVVPTVTPTVAPTVAPTVVPTVTPTVAPTVAPTVVPTIEPSIEPTVEPTVTPSVECTHNFQRKQVVTQGDCQTPSLVLYQCEFCPETETREEVNIGAEYHTIIFTAATESTCKEQGNSAYYYCSTCQKYFADESCTTETNLQNATLPLADHTVTFYDMVESTCKEQGVLSHYHCSVCDKYFVDEKLSVEVTQSTVLRPYAAHAAIYYAAKDSTCEEQGNLEHYFCTVCEKYFADEACKQEMPKSDVILRLAEEHPYPDTYLYTPTGHWIESTCSHKVRKPNSFAAHRMGSWQETKPATYETEGEESRYCVCGYSETRPTDKLTQPPVIPSPDLPDEPTEQTILDVPFAKGETFVFGGWQRRTVQELQGSVSATNDGTGSLHMYLTEEGKAAHNSFTQWLSTSFNVTEGKKYVVSFAYRVINPGVGSGAQLIDGISTVNSMEDPNTFLYQFGIQWHTLQADVWHKMKLEFTATETATYYLIFKMYGLYKYSEYWIDDLKIVEHAIDEPYYKVENGNPVTISFIYPDKTYDSLDCIAGDVIDFPQPKRIAGQVFVGWYTSQEYARRVYAPATDGNRRYFAKYVPAVTLTFHQNNGKDDIIREVAYNGCLGELMFPEWEGYVFAGWFTADNEPFSAYRNCTKNGEYYARWVEEEQAAEFMDNFGFLNEIPMITINTEGGVGITSKFDYINANIIIESELNADWNVNTTTEIRGRGNSSWWCMAKPSYRLKLTDKKTNVLGMTGERNYALVSNHADKTMIRNLLAYGFGADEDFNQGWEPEFHYVYLTINGDFRGLYMLIETIRASKDRLNLAGTPASNLDTGFLLEQVPYNRMLEDLERNPDEPYIYVAGTYYWNVKYPEREDFATQEEWDAVLTYITDKMSLAMRALYNGDRDTYLKYIDEDSFIDYWLMQDLFSNFDCTQASIYVYKAQGGLITAGPLWDFDIGINNISYVNRSPETWYGFQVNSAGAGLMKHPESKRKVYERIIEFYEGDWQLYLYSVYGCMDALEEAWYKNYERWDYNEKVFETPEWILALPDREAQYDFVFTWLAEKMNFLYRESKKGLEKLS